MTHESETAIRESDEPQFGEDPGTTDTPETLTIPPAEHVRAENVQISQGGAGSIEATTVSVTQGGAGRVRAHELTISQGGVGIARTDRLHLGEGGNAFAVVSDDAALEPGSNVFMLFARSVSGDPRPVIDWRAAAAFGVGVGLAVSILRRRSG